MKIRKYQFAFMMLFSAMLLTCSEEGEKLPNEAMVLDFSFTTTENPSLLRNLKGYIRKSKNEILFHNSQLDQVELVPVFSVSPDALVFVNGVQQTSGVTAVNFSNAVTYRIEGKNGSNQSYTVKMTREIVDLKDFLTICPMNDPNIGQIMEDFEIRLNGEIVSDFPCSEPYYIMSEEQYTTEKTYLQSLRFLYYLDYDNPVTLPWTNLRLYDWVKSKIAGINVEDGTGGGYCCPIIDGKTFIAVGNIKAEGEEYLKSSANLFETFLLMNVSLILHEARHVDGYYHTSGCCSDGSPCDQTLDFNDPSAYGIMVWWHKSVWEKKFEFGVDCLLQNDPLWRSNIKTIFNPNNWSKTFCSGDFTYSFPSNAFDDCDFQ